jgi:hypothetical protein
MLHVENCESTEYKIAAYINTCVVMNYFENVTVGSCWVAKAIMVCMHI